MAETTDMFQRLGELDQLEQMLSGATEPGALAEIDLDRVRELLGKDAVRVARGARRSWRGASRRPVSSSSGRAASSSRRKDFVESASGRWRTCSSTSRQDRLGEHGLVRIGRRPRACRRHQALRVRRPVQSPHRTDDAQCAQARRWPRRVQPVGPACSSRFASARRLRDRADRAPDPVRDGASASTCRCRCRCGTTSSPRRRSQSRCRRSSPANSRGTTSASSASPSGRGRSGRRSCRRSRGTTSTARTCSTRCCWHGACSRATTATRQIVVITDGEPTAHLLEDGEVFFNYPPVPETVEATLHEVLRCTRDGILINTFVLDATGHLRTFIEKMTQLNRGTGFFHDSGHARRLRPRRLRRAPPAAGAPTFPRGVTADPRCDVPAPPRPPSVALHVLEKIPLASDRATVHDKSQPCNYTVASR